MCAETKPDGEGSEEEFRRGSYPGLRCALNVNETDVEAVLESFAGAHTPAFVVRGFVRMAKWPCAWGFAGAHTPAFVVR